MNGGAPMRAPRSRRARVMIVGPLDASALAIHFAQPPMRVSNMFEAIAEVTVAHAGNVIASAIVHEDLLRGQHQHAAEALRKIDPSLRVVGVTSSASTAPQAGARGVDAWIACPLKPDDLRRALDDDTLLAAAASAPSAAVVELEESTPAADIASARDGEPAAATHGSPPRQPEVVEPPQNVASLSPAPQPAAPIDAPVAVSLTATSATEAPLSAGTARNTFSSPAPAAPAPPPVAAAIGDTDLINAILHDPAGVQPTALRLIAYHTGWNDVSVLDATDDRPRTDAAEIVHGAQRFGQLISTRARPAELRLWADWLAHWLAIEHDLRRHRADAFTDCLTGAGNRRFFDAFLSSAIASAKGERRPLTVMVFDIDNFKLYNDQFGHDAGDDILREIVRLLKSVIRQGDVVCRIGGDEFVVIFADTEPPRTLGSKPPENVQQIAQRFQSQVCSMRYPKLGPEAHGTLSISAGLATYPWDGTDPQSLLRHADQLAMESKRKGKNALTLGRRDAEGSN
jgi:diguanylate cyclase (GGDEF)-like protein